MVLVKDKSTGKTYDLQPIKVWELKPKNRPNAKAVKIGLFKNPETGKYFRAKIP